MSRDENPIDRTRQLRPGGEEWVEGRPSGRIIGGDIAQSWLVLQLTHSGSALGIATALQYVPILFLGPYGGLIADRISKRKILYFTQSLSGVLALITVALAGLACSARR